MDKQLSSDTIAALRDLAREVGDARGLGEDAREELYGHLEDKTLGYLSGEDGITEADAVLLTREHFGDPGAFPEAVVQVQAQFRSLVSLPRRLAAVAVLTLTVGIAFSAVRLLLAFFVDTETAVDLFAPVNLPALWVVVVLKMAAIVVVLRGWLARERRGLRLWYQDRTPAAIALILLALVSLQWLVPDVRFDQKLLTAEHGTLLRTIIDMPRSIYWSFIALGPALAMLMPLMWIAWTDRRAFMAKAVLGAAVAWGALNAASDFPEIAVGAPSYVISVDSRGFEIQSPPMGVSDMLEAWGYGSDITLQSALVLTGYFAALAGILPGIAVAVYLIAGLGGRLVRRYGELEVRWRPAAR
ncbi:MAG: hypothetical protein IT364_08825 [Candidatus Hydrogenedentes bacterium]|nr:hypothetical protein [Candidatus Hydrogenedentota bacterium]